MYAAFRRTARELRVIEQGWQSRESLSTHTAHFARKGSFSGASQVSSDPGKASDIQRNRTLREEFTVSLRSGNCRGRGCFAQAFLPIWTMAAGSSKSCRCGSTALVLAAVAQVRVAACNMDVRQSDQSSRTTARTKSGSAGFQQHISRRTKAFLLIISWAFAGILQSRLDTLQAETEISVIMKHRDSSTPK